MSELKFDVLVGLSEDSLKEKAKAVVDALKGAGVAAKQGVPGVYGVAYELADFFSIPEIVILKGHDGQVNGLLGMKTASRQPADLLDGGDWGELATLSAQAETIKSAVA